VGPCPGVHSGAARLIRRHAGGVAAHPGNRPQLDLAAIGCPLYPRRHCLPQQRICGPISGKDSGVSIAVDDYRRRSPPTEYCARCGLGRYLLNDARPPLSSAARDAKFSWPSDQSSFRSVVAPCRDPHAKAGRVVMSPDCHCRPRIRHADARFQGR